ncbi:MAG: hypothetical protein P1V35_16240 [Planctomycetota bacterium]|nr:hypothetical protein [Planctomycetota bacterium]
MSDHKAQRRKFALLRTGPKAGVGVLLTLILGLGSFLSCQSTIPNRETVGERFPTVTGESLEGEAVSFPMGEPCVLLIGYKQKAQFDADRWLLGLLQLPVGVPLFEVPTIKGLFPRVIGSYIDDGMRGGIPSEDWQSVVTLYGSDAESVAQFTGTQGGNNMRVVLLDGEGQVRWFHDRGYSARFLLDLKAAIGKLVKNG